MKIAIIGYGRMGKLVAEIAASRGHTIDCIVDEDNREMLLSPEFAACDVAIEFTGPSSALDNVRACFAAGVPVVSGSTGWKDGLEEMKLLAERGEGSLLWSSNFSLGMNIFFDINRRLARLLDATGLYTPAIEEVHHIHKLDHPSGTAITLAEDLIGAAPSVKAWREAEKGEAVERGVLPISHRREGEVPGTHTVSWLSEADEISITHRALNRRGFALGAVTAAEWLVARRQPGYYTMRNIMDSILRD